MTVAILVPSKGRPKECARMVRSAYQTSSGKVQIYIAVEAHEFEEYRAEISLPEGDRVGAVLLTTPESTTVHKWNMLAELAMRQPCEFFMLGADDMVFQTPCWDLALEGGKPHVYSLQDSRDANGTPHVLVTREYIERMGWFLPPIFLHWFCDSWTVAIAKANGCFTHLRDFELFHDKPSDRGESDATHRGIRERGWHQRDEWVEKNMRPWLEEQKKKLGASESWREFAESKFDDVRLA